jgi:hypothetical protein
LLGKVGEGWTGKADSKGKSLPRIDELKAEFLNCRAGGATRKHALPEEFSQAREGWFF